MRTRLIILLLLFALPVQAQSESQHVIDSLKVEIHLRDIEVRRADMQALTFAKMLAVPQVFETRSHNEQSEFLPFVNLGLQATPHSEASVFGGFGLDYRSGRFGLGCSARYQFDPSIKLDSGSVPAKWHTTFTGGLKFFLY